MTDRSGEYPYKAIIDINGMACEHCVHRVENAFLKLGVLAEADLDEKRAVIHMKEKLSDDTLLDTVRKLGFEANIAH